MHSHVENSRVGLSGVSKIAERNPRELVIKVIEENPGIEKKDAFELFREQVAGNPDYLRAMEYYFFVHMWEYAFGPTSRTKSDPIERMEARQRQSEMVEHAKAQIIMLDLTMPNGKPMKECTGAEMAKFGNRFQKLAERVGKSKTVGEVLNEDQVKAILK